MRHQDVVTRPDNPSDQRLQGSEWNKDHHLVELSADLSDPADGTAVMWMSDGTGSGDAGDIMMKITSGGVTKITTLVDFSGLAAGPTTAQDLRKTYIPTDGLDPIVY